MYNIDLKKIETLTYDDVVTKRMILPWRYISKELLSPHDYEKFTNEEQIILDEYYEKFFTIAKNNENVFKLSKYNSIVSEHNKKVEEIYEEYSFKAAKLFFSLYRKV